MDRTDYQILNILQADCRATLKCIGDQVGLTAPAVSERVRRMEEKGVIRDFRIDIDRARLDSGMTGFILVALEPEKYNSFWKLHGKVFKLGYSDFVNRDRITPLLRFNSSAMEDADGLTSLDDYISRARESQKEIWYVAAPSREAAKVNPHSEVFRRKGLEVLYLYEPVDEFALETLAKYKDYTFKAVEHADSAVLDAFADTDEQPKAAPLSNEDMNEFDKLLETIRKVLGDQIKDARVSHRLADSPACLVSPDDGVTSSMERLMRVMQKDDSIPQKIFEINRDHPLLRTMLKLSKADPDDPQLAEMIQSLFDSTLLLDGYIKDPHALASRATKLLEQASAWPVSRIWCLACHSWHTARC